MAAMFIGVCNALEIEVQPVTSHYWSNFIGEFDVQHMEQRSTYRAGSVLELTLGYPSNV